MNQIPKSTYTKEDIVNYVEGMQIKKASIGGYDRVDVYVQIQELLKMYSAYMDSELDKQKDTLLTQQKEIKDLIIREKEAREELNSRTEMEGKRNQRFQRQKEEITDLLQYKELAEKRQAENEALNREVELQKKELAELKKLKNRVFELQSMAGEQNRKVEEVLGELEQSKAYTEELENKVSVQQNELKELQELNSYMKREEISQKDNEMLRQLQAELSHYQKVAVELKQKNQQQSEEINKLGKREAEASSAGTLALKEELKKQTDEAAVLKDKIKEYQVLLADYLTPTSDDIQEELEDRERIIMEKDQELLSVTQKLKDREEELEDLKGRKEGLQIQSAQNYTNEISAILREARREGENIINNSRIEAEKEMIRLLNLRAKFNQEKEIYRSWCKRVDEEKRSIEEFLEQLTSQYKHVDGTMNTIRERTSSLKLSGQISDNQQDDIKGIDYDKKDLE